MSALLIFFLAACPVSKLILSFAMATISVRCFPVQSVLLAGLGSRDLEIVCLQSYTSLNMSLWKNWVFCVTRKVIKKATSFQKSKWNQLCIQIALHFFLWKNNYRHAMLGREWKQDQVVGSRIFPTEENHSRALFRATD